MQILMTTVFSMFAAVIGLLVGNFLTRARERENWLRDRRMEEWRELLAAISKSHTALLVLFDRHVEASDPEWIAAEADSKVTFFDRIFTVQQIEELDLWTKWLKLVTDFRTGRDVEAFIRNVREIRRTIIATAVKC